jgi:hypothetical protein
MVQHSRPRTIGLLLPRQQQIIHSDHQEKKKTKVAKGIQTSNMGIHIFAHDK